MNERLRGELPEILGKPLSLVELEVLELLARGCRYSEIARFRGRSVPTIKGEARRVFQKLGAVNAAHAVTIAKDKGLL